MWAQPLNNKLPFIVYFYQFFKKLIYVFWIQKSDQVDRSKCTRYLIDIFVANSNFEMKFSLDWSWDDELSIGYKKLFLKVKGKW